MAKRLTFYFGRKASDPIRESLARASLRDISSAKNIGDLARVTQRTWRAQLDRFSSQQVMFAAGNYDHADNCRSAFSFSPGNSCPFTPENGWLGGVRKRELLGKMRSAA